MNPAFAIIALILCISVWFLASGTYKAIGQFLGTIGKDAIDTMKDVDGEESKTEWKEKD